MREPEKKNHFYLQNFRFNKQLDDMEKKGRGFIKS